jgi:hypothetical protein
VFYKEKMHDRNSFVHATLTVSDQGVQAVCHVLMQASGVGTGPVEGSNGMLSSYNQA